MKIKFKNQFKICQLNLYVLPTNLYIYPNLNHVSHSGTKLPNMQNACPNPFTKVEYATLNPNFNFYLYQYASKVPI